VAVTAATMPPDQAGDDSGEEPRDWLFTFGAEIPALEHRYVRIHGTFMEARLKMHALYSFRWSAQYASEDDAGVERYHLTELVLPPRLQEQPR
jgi:hypothetical protein